MKIYFSLIFLLFGLPIVFSLESIFGFSKDIGYGIVFIILLLGISDIKLFKRLYINKYQLFLFLIACGLFLSFIIEHIYNKQLIEIMIIVYILFLSFSYNVYNNINSKMLYIPLFISSVSVLFIYLSTPLSLVYWHFHGGRLFIGDTNNPNLVAFVSMVNIITVLYILFKIKLRKSYKILLYLILPFAAYLYFMSFSKSSVIGIFLIILYLFSRYSLKMIFNLKFVFFITVIISIIILFGYNLDKYVEIIIRSINSLLYGSNGNMSASIRHENFKYFFEHYSSFNIFGHGINTFRLDSPILQLYIEYGFFIALFFFILMVAIPMMIIINRKKLTLLEEYTILIYLFYFPNLFFHGTPYEWHTWLPVILFYMILKKRKVYYAVANNSIYIQTNTKRNN